MFLISTSKKIFILIALCAFSALSITLITQYGFNLKPCAWCVLRRLIDLAIGMIGLLAAYADTLAGPKMSWILRIIGASLTILFALLGILSTFYQHIVSANQLTCAPTFAEHFIATTGLDTLLPSIFGIYAHCRPWRTTLFGLEYSFWSLMLFVGLTLLGMMALFKCTPARTERLR